MSVLIQDETSEPIRAYLDMLLEILRTLEGLATELALVRLERDMDTDMRGDVVTLHSGSAA